jgi:hypothetical protein
MFLRAHLDDVCSDMSVFHRVDDVYDLDAVTFFKLAWRLPSYQGRMAAVVRDLQEQMENGDTAGSGPVPAREQPVLTAAALRSNPAFSAGGHFAPLFEVTQVPKADD